jgi:hypothetical protein
LRHWRADPYADDEAVAAQRFESVTLDGFFRRLSHRRGSSSSGGGGGGGGGGGSGGGGDGDRRPWVLFSKTVFEQVLHERNTQRWELAVRVRVLVVLVPVPAVGGWRV